MNSQQLRQHYLQLWYLLQSLGEPWWTADEKDQILNALKAAIPNDLNLNRLNISDPNFLTQLADELETILAARQEIPSGNIPPREVFEEYQKVTAQKESPWVFLEEKGRKRKPLMISDSIYRILKQNQIIDVKNRARIDATRKTNPLIIDQAQKEIGRLLALERARENLAEQMFFALQPRKNPVPVGFLEFEFFGDNRRMGIVNRVANEVIAALAKGDTFDFKIATNILNKYLNNSPVFQSFTRDQQLKFKKQALKAILVDTISGYTLPKNDKIIITQKGHDVTIQVIPHGDPAKGTYNVYSASVEPKAVLERVREEIGGEATKLSYEGMEAFANGISRNPVGTLLSFPVETLIGLTPDGIKKPISNFFGKDLNDILREISYDPIGFAFRSPFYLLTAPIPKKTKKSISYAFSPNRWPELIAKGVLKPAGLVRENNLWAHQALLGWVGEKAVTGIGEIFSKLTSFIPVIGKPVSKRISRRVGKDRKREESLATGIAGLVLDTVLLAPKLLWWSANKLPFVKAFKGWLGSKWFDLRFALETRFPILKLIRLGKVGISSFLKAIPHGLISGGLTYILFPGAHPAIPISVGFGETLFRFWRYLSLNEGFLTWAQGPHTSGLGSAIGKMFPTWSRWAYLPTKGFLMGYGIGTLLGLPTWARVGLSFLSGGIEYGYYAGLKPLLPAFISRWITGPLGKAFGFITEIIFNPGTLIGYQLATLLGATPLQSILAGLLGGASFYSLSVLILESTFPYSMIGLAGWFGGGWLANILGLTGWSAFALQVFTTGGSIYLSYVGVQALMSWVTSSVAAGLNAALAGTATAAAGISAAAVLSVIWSLLIVVGLTLLTVFIVASAFQMMRYTALSRRGLIDPRLEITKKVEAEKNSNGDIVALNYTITYSYNPGPSSPPGNLTIVQMTDTFVDLIKLGHPGIGYVFYNLTNFDDPSPSSFILQTTAGQIVCKPFLDPSTASNEDLIWRPQECPELEIQPGETKTLSVHLVFTQPWTANTGWNGNKLCNDLGMAGKTPDGQEIVSSYPRVCIGRDGEVLPGGQDAAILARNFVTALQNCGINTINDTNLATVEDCLLKDKNVPVSLVPAIMSEVEHSVQIGNGNFQCVGLPMVMEAATGGNLPNASRSLNLGLAREFWTDLPGYIKIESRHYNNIMLGDIIVWDNQYGGHLAMVTQVYLAPDGKVSKIEVAEASNPKPGFITLREIPVDDTGIVAPPGTLLGWLRRE